MSLPHFAITKARTVHKAIFKKKFLDLIQAASRLYCLTVQVCLHFSCLFVNLISIYSRLGSLKDNYYWIYT